MIVGYRDVVPPLFFPIECAFTTADEAQNSIAYEAIHGGRMEDKLKEREESFKKKGWTERKLIYARCQEGLFRRECDVRGLEEPIFNLQPPDEIWQRGPC